MVDTSVFIVAAMSLAVFDISKEVDFDGNIIEPTIQPLSGSVRCVVLKGLQYYCPPLTLILCVLFSHPSPFGCTIKPRSSRSVDLLNSL